MTLVWSPRAKRNMGSLLSYVEEDSPQNAKLVAERIAKAIALLERQPEIGRPGRVIGTRELVVPNTPCIIPYRLTEQKIQLIAVFHGSRKWPLIM